MDNLGLVELSHLLLMIKEIGEEIVPEEFAWLVVDGLRSHLLHSATGMQSRRPVGGGRRL